MRMGMELKGSILRIMGWLGRRFAVLFPPVSSGCLAWFCSFWSALTSQLSAGWGLKADPFARSPLASGRLGGTMQLFESNRVGRIVVLLLEGLILVDSRCGEEL